MEQWSRRVREWKAGKRVGRVGDWKVGKRVGVQKSGVWEIWGWMGGMEVGGWKQSERLESLRVGSQMVRSLET